MAFDLSQFRSRVTNVLRPNLFEVYIPDGPEEGFKYTCKAASLPQITVAALNVTYQGRIIKHAGDKSFEDWQITVIMTGQDERRYFDNWLNQLSENDLGVRAPTINQTEYKRDCRVDVLDQSGEPAITYDFIGVFPNSLGEVKLNWDQSQDIGTFDVTLSYDRYGPVG